MKILTLGGNPLPFQPVRDFSLCQLLNDRTTNGGIVLPDDAEIGPPRMKVLAVGEGRLCENGAVVPYPIQAGDICVCRCSGGSAPERFTHGGEEFFLVHCHNLVGYEPRERLASQACPAA